jgi:uncharacterized membrane protein
MLDRSECMLGMGGKTCRKVTLMPKIRQKNNTKRFLKNIVVIHELYTGWGIKISHILKRYKK